MIVRMLRNRSSSTLVEDRAKDTLSVRNYAIVAVGIVLATCSRLYVGLRVFPNPVYAKSDMDAAERFDRGLSYFADTFSDHPGLFFGSIRVSQRYFGAFRGFS